MPILSFMSIALAASINCASAPYGPPSNKTNLDAISICHTGYYTEYSPEEKDPIVGVWTITKDTSVGCGDRDGNFKQDPLAKGKDASPSVYNKSGYDKGHVADAKDFTYDSKLEPETFYMTNMLPEVPGLNRNGWKWFETSSRFYALKYGKVIVYSGPVFSPNDKKIDGVDVPEQIWKIVYVPSINKAISILVPNDDIKGGDILDFITSVSEIEKVTNLTIPLPSNYDKTTVENKTNWAPVFKELTEENKEVCHRGN